jgi:hypothetical protein
LALAMSMCTHGSLLEALDEVQRAYDFSFLFNYPSSIGKAISQLTSVERMKPFQDAMASIGRAAKEFHRVQQEAAKPFEELRKAQAATAALGKGFAAYSDQLKGILAGVKLPKFELPRIDRDYFLEPHNQLAMDYGWPPLYRLPLGEPRQLFAEAEKLENEKARQDFINEQITAFYRDELESVLANWQAQPFLKDTARMAIITDAFEAHQQGKFSLSSPTLLAHTEGVFVDYVEVGRKKTVGSGQYKKHITRLKKQQGEKSLVYGLAEILLVFVEKHGLYGNKVVTNPIAEAISRQSILHGRSTAYAKREDISLRHLLWLDCVIHLVNDLNPSNEEGS